MHDLRGFNRLDVPRNNVRTLQTSMIMLQSWRANCDIQFLLYESDPEQPDAADIARVTDYVVSYACKGSESLKQEKDQIAALVMQAEDVWGNDTDVKTLARKF